MRARDKAAVSALRSALAAVENAEAVVVEAGAADRGAGAVEASPVGAGATEAVRRELSESGVAEIVRAEIAERLDAAAQLGGDAVHAVRVATLRAEADVLVRFLDET
ncbi:GatB/YqeY domain-containing protein [Streptomyces beihaiensis]|uniref:Uncharacterized protein n=1 Tax=Streptomyces beihaiensis TaxID=2984495 RepID=A0ABT3U6R2_9ACTN|nr:hypothetical protein [Streptomyces beihaiensis]MCX3063895.1 hypothetical protein [Streptomyces beihaiensis]